MVNIPFLPLILRRAFNDYFVMLADSSIVHDRFISTLLRTDISPTTNGQQMKATVLIQMAHYLKVSHVESKGVHVLTLE